MSIVEHAALSSAPPGATQNDRLRVITAGRVGNMEARLGTSGFDIVAIAYTEAELISALSADDPDAIVVEADLCESLEHVRELAPDAVLIVVGDHTPAGALGRIERGVSGTVMAGLLHALVADGVGGAVIWGFLPAVPPPRQGSVVDHFGASLLSAKVEATWTHIADALQEHTGLIAAASTVVVTASASLLLTLGVPPVHRSAEPVRVPDRAVEVVAHDEIAATTELGAPAARRSISEPADRVTPSTADTFVPDQGADAASPNVDQAAETSPVPEETPPPGTSPAPEGTPPPDTGPTPEETPPIETPPPPANDATLPPGAAKGWDEQRPPKNEDNGNHTGWGNNSVPDDPAAASAGHRPDDETPAYGTQEDPSVTADPVTANPVTANPVTANPDGATATADA